MQKLKKILSALLAAAVIVAALPLSVLTALAATTDDYSDSLVYGTDGKLTRAEWLHNLSVVFNMTVDSGNEPDNYFADLPETHKYYSDVLLTVEFGVVNVEAGGEICPDDLATRDFTASTLNYCLGYQPTDNDTYSFSDSAECTDKTAALVAVERGWFKLISGKFSPDKQVETAEVKSMLNDALAVLEAAEVDENYDSKYTLQSGVIAIPEETEVTQGEDGSILITDCPKTISAGDKFAVYFNGIPVVYTAQSVLLSGNVTEIKTDGTADNNAFTAVDGQGKINSADMIFEAAEGVELEEEIVETPSVQKSAAIRRAAGVKEFNRNFNAKVNVPANGGNIQIEVKIYHPVVTYSVSNSEASVYIEGTTETTFSCSGNITAAAGVSSIPIIKCSIFGVGSFEIAAEFNISCNVSTTLKGRLTAGFECRKGERIRSIKNFQKDEFYCVVNLTASAGVRAVLGVTELPFVHGYVWAAAGMKSTMNAVIRPDGETPQKCVDLKAWVYANYGYSVGVSFPGWKKSETKQYDIYNFKNSPVRIVHHYDDGKPVSSCSKTGTKQSYYTPSTSVYSGSGWSGYTGTYGIDAATGESVPLYTYEQNGDENGITITKYNGNSTYLNIPAEIDGYTVTRIGYNAFENKSIVNLTIPDTVTEIDDYAFYNCTSLKDVKLSNSLSILGIGVFGKTSLEEITIPKSLEQCNASGGMAYSGYSYNFNGKDFFYLYTGPFHNIESLKTVKFEKGITKIPQKLFAGCISIENIEIPDTVTEIGYHAFSDCLRLKNITIGNSVTKINDYAFSQCVSLPNVIISDTVTEIGGYAFYDCTSLKEVKLSNSLSILGIGVFGKTSLEEITIPKSLEQCNASGGMAYSGYSYNFNGKDFFYLYTGPFHNIESLKTVKFEKGITKIPQKLFAGCISIENIEIPDTVTEIGYQAFSDCLRLKKITIGNSVTEIDDCAFSQCVSLLNVIIPDTVTDIGTYTFENCSSLESVKLPNGRQNIVENMFYNCSSLKTIELPSGVSAIRRNAFSGCTSLESVTFKNGKSALKEIEYYAFYGCTALREAVLPETVKTIGNYAFQNSTSLEKVYILQSVKTVGTGAFKGCTALSDLKIADYSITEIQADTFMDCPALAEVILPKGLKTVGDQAFKNGTGLIKATIPDSVTEISTTAFSYPAKTAIYGSAGSYAETFAANGGFKFNDNKVEAEGFALSDGAENIDLEVGETYRAVFEFFPENATDTVTLKSSNSNVSISGMDIYARYTGDCVITAAASNGLTYEFSVHTRRPSKITVKQQPDKLRYKVGESFDRTGAIIEVAYNDGFVKTVDDWTYTGFESSSEGSCAVTVRWVSADGSVYTATINTEIYNPAPKLTGIKISRLPYKLIYAKRTALNTAGIKVMGMYDDGSEKELTGCTFGKINALKLGVQKITVTYGEFSTQFNVTVTASGYADGDVNQDGVVDIRDLIRLKKRLAAEKAAETETSDDPADVDKNSLLNALDIAVLKKMLLGIS